jgi:hypothetical protein
MIERTEKGCHCVAAHYRFSFITPKENSTCQGAVALVLPGQGNLVEWRSYITGFAENSNNYSFQRSESYLRRIVAARSTWHNCTF